MIQTLKIEDLTCELVGGYSEKVTYVIYPYIEPLSESLMERMAAKHSTSIVAVYVPADEWNNYLTPWPEPPESKGFPPFGGEAAKFLSILTGEIIPQAEKTLGLSPGAERNLIGVSLSGLFALWEWLQNDTFHSLACLSGSFWYAGFMDWFDSREIPSKSGSAYFLLGKDEPKAKIKAYQSVGVNTEAVVERLEKAGVKVKFEWVPGNHFSDPVHRLETGFANL